MASLITLLAVIGLVVSLTFRGVVARILSILGSVLLLTWLIGSGTRSRWFWERCRRGTNGLIHQAINRLETLNIGRGFNTRSSSPCREPDNIPVVRDVLHPD
jgi:hypothetical protein